MGIDSLINELINHDKTGAALRLALCCSWHEGVRAGMRLRNKVHDIDIKMAQEFVLGAQLMALQEILEAPDAHGLLEVKQFLVEVEMEARFKINEMMEDKR